jgi:hypothetical protein
MFARQHGAVCFCVFLPGKTSPPLSGAVSFRLQRLKLMLNDRVMLAILIATLIMTTSVFVLFYLALR